MKTISSFEKEVPKKNDYPKLMVTGEHKKVIVCMKSEGKGCVVYSESPLWKVFDCSNDWAVELFEDFHGEVNIKIKS